MSSAQYSGQDTEPSASDHDRVQFPCSIAQERFWLLDRIEPGNPALNIAVRWQLNGHVSSDIVERAFKAIIARHEILRTSFVDINGSPLQSVAPSMPFRIASIDLSSLREDQPVREAERIGQLEARTPFDLSHAPLLRVTLVRVAEQKSLLLLTVHHMVCDGWSIGVLAQEFGEQYEALRRGRAGRLPELPIQYGEYALWHRERIRRGDFELDIAYWKHQLAGLPYLEVPADKPHRSSAAAGGDIVGLLLDRSLTDALQAVSRRHGNTLFVTALAALIVLLNRYTGETDIAIGTQVAGRDEVELEAMVGVFINTVVLRHDVSDNPHLPELLQRTQDTVQGALDHQNLPMEQLIQILQPKRDMTRNPFFSVNFIFQRSFIENATYSDFSLVDLPSHSPGGLYDLNFFMVERPEGWRISCEYNSDLFLRETVSHQLNSLRTLFAGIVQDPQRRIADLPLLDAGEQDRLVELGQGDVAVYPLDYPLQWLLEAQAARSPRAVAVVHAERRLTYAQLDKEANRLARYLRRQGVVPGTLVGLLLPRRIDLIVTLLAVLKAGGIFMPFDPAYPDDQLKSMMKEARLPLLLTQEPRSDLFANAERVIALEAARTAIAREQTGRLDIEVTGEQIACVLFTSGATGRRRPVQVPHRALVNLLSALAVRPGLEAGDTLVSVSTVASDMAVVELLLPLMVGARLVLADASDGADGHALLALLQRSKASVMQGRPAVWLRLLEAGWTGLPRLKMLCGGDSLSRGLADRLLATGGELWNLYGLTEATIWSSVVRIEPGTDRLPLGRPIPNTQIHVLDRNGHLLPVGAVGELHVGGAGATGGILHQSPSSRDPGLVDFASVLGTYQRLCGTGDLGRRRDDGRIDYLGRSGPPVKLRGFRVETDDIEAEILRHSGVGEVSVTLMQDHQRESLVAHVVPLAVGTDPDVLVAALRIRLGRALPKYMIPDTITVHPSLPHTPDDRVDLRTLVRPVEALSMPDEQRLPDQDAEGRLIALWSSLLGRTGIGVTDDFFDLGGHSLLAARLLAGISREFGKQIDFATLFRAPTIRELAALMVRDADVVSESGVVQVQPAGRLAPVFAIDHTWIYDNLARKLGSDRPFFALHATHTSNRIVAAGETASPYRLQTMAAEQIRIIRQQQPRGPYILLGLCMAGVLAYEIAQQLQDQGEQVPLLVMIDTWSPGYLSHQSRASALLADWSYRWQIVISDFRRDTDHGLRDKLAFGATRLREFITKRLRGSSKQRVVMLDNGGDVDPIELLNAAARTAKQRPFTGRICLLHRDTMPSGRFLDPQLGWGAFAAGGIETHPLPGDHFSMFRDPGVTTMAEIIDRILKAEQV